MKQSMASEPSAHEEGTYRTVAKSAVSFFWPFARLLQRSQNPQFFARYGR